MVRRFWCVVFGTSEFGDVSLGATLFTQVHGSSSIVHRFSDNIASFEAFDMNGEKVTCHRLERQNILVVFSVSIRTQSNFPLTRYLSIHSSNILPNIVHILRNSFSTTVHYYRSKNTCLVWKHCKGIGTGAIRLTHIDTFQEDICISPDYILQKCTTYMLIVYLLLGQN